MRKCNLVPRRQYVMHNCLVLTFIKFCNIIPGKTNSISSAYTCAAVQFLTSTNVDDDYRAWVCLSVCAFQTAFYFAFAAITKLQYRKQQEASKCVQRRNRFENGESPHQFECVAESDDAYSMFAITSIILHFHRLKSKP